MPRADYVIEVIFLSIRLETCMYPTLADFVSYVYMAGATSAHPAHSMYNNPYYISGHVSLKM